MNNLKVAHAAIVLDMAKRSLQPTNPDLGKLGPEINKMAVDALTEGVGSDQWTEYMRLYASNEAELAQLADPDKKDSWLRQQRAYIVSNAICDIGTNGKTQDKVGIEINIADDQPDAVFIAKRKIKIPTIE